MPDCIQPVFPSTELEWAIVIISVSIGLILSLYALIKLFKSNLQTNGLPVSAFILTLNILFDFFYGIANAVLFIPNKNVNFIAGLLTNIFTSFSLSSTFMISMMGLHKTRAEQRNYAQKAKAYLTILLILTAAFNIFTYFSPIINSFTLVLFNCIINVTFILLIFLFNLITMIRIRYYEFEMIDKTPRNISLVMETYWTSEFISFILYYNYCFYPPSFELLFGFFSSALGFINYLASLQRIQKIFEPYVPQIQNEDPDIYSSMKISYSNLLEITGAHLKVDERT